MAGSPPGARDDRARLRSLAERYFNALDRRDLVAVGECFTQDAEAEYLGGDWRMVGRQALVEGLSVITRYESSIHVPATMAFTISGDTASGEVLATVTLAEIRDGQPYVIARGLRYSDGYTRAGGEWRIHRRRQDALWQYETQGVTPSVPRGGQG